MNIVKRVVNKIKYTFFKEYYEQKEIRRRADYYSRFIKKGDLVFDVGANMGNRVEPLLRIGARIVAVEPQDNCCEFLQQQFGEKITIIKKALGSAEGTQEFMISNVNVFSSLSPEWVEAVKNTNRFGPEVKWEEKKMIEITTLDKLIEQFGAPVFIKIDVEGYEFEVLSGLSAPINTISFEYAMPESMAKSIKCIEQIFATNKNIECNYSIGENMEMASPSWMDPQTFIQLIRTEKFLNSGWGDIYVRSLDRKKTN